MPEVLQIKKSFSKLLDTEKSNMLNKFVENKVVLQSLYNLMFEQRNVKQATLADKQMLLSYRKSQGQSNWPVQMLDSKTELRIENGNLIRITSPKHQESKASLRSTRSNKTLRSEVMSNKTLGEHMQRIPSEYRFEQFAAHEAPALHGDSRDRNRNRLKANSGFTATSVTTQRLNEEQFNQVEERISTQPTTQQFVFSDKDTAGFEQTNHDSRLNVVVELESDEKGPVDGMRI